MLTRLSIKNYALIDELDVDFSKGFNIVTGQTGAGKSIILGALSLILGSRAGSNSLRNNSKKCIIEGVFNIENYGLKKLFEENDLDFENQSIFRRELTPSGKSRAFINDTPVSIKLMFDIGTRLIDIHSQHQNLQLSNHIFQLQLVDIIAGTGPLLDEYKKLYFSYNEAVKKLSSLKEKAEGARAGLDYLEFQFNQLEEAELKEGEQDELEKELEKLTHAEEIKSVYTGMVNIFEGDGHSVLQRLQEAIGRLDKIKGYSNEAAVLMGRIESAYLELKDISEEASQQFEAIEYDPQRIEQLTERLGLIYGLQQKHHVSSIGELIGLKDKLGHQISEVVDFDIEIVKLEKEVAKNLEALSHSADKLSRQRKKCFADIEHKVTGILKQLGMPHSQFKVTIAKKDNFSETGKDSVNFLFCANKGASVDEISRIASGGEASRLMLAIKSLITDKKALPTIIFDEIDSGVSGEIALKMGNILKEFSRSTQIINITHLPQIAGKGDHHYLVYKYEDNKGRTYTSIRKLSEEERVEEMAKMVGGDTPTSSAFNTARELLN
ncbi:MAG: DNA repair protein RecN [Chlorobi bacterium]|nr:DNA repair protein RecN [Chlorobiota bacterium]